MMPLLALVLSLVAARPSPPSPSLPEERAIIEAALRYPILMGETDGGRFRLRSRTAPLGTARAYFRDFAPKVQISWQARDQPGEFLTIPPDVLASLDARNTSTLSLRGVRQPARTARMADRDVRYAKAIVVSRPGVSADGLHALIEIGTDDASGFCIYLEKREGHWVAIADGANYES